MPFYLNVSLSVVLHSMIEYPTISHSVMYNNLVKFIRIEI